MSELAWLGAAVLLWLLVRRSRKRRRHKDAQEAGARPAPAPERERRPSRAGAWSRYAKPRLYLATRREAAFEHRLRAMLDRTGKRHWRINSQVAMSAVFDGAKGRRHRRWSGPAVPPWCLDFVLTERGKIKGIVELNDWTHRLEGRRRRDANLAAGCRALGVPIYFVEGEEWTAAERWLATLT